MAKWKWVERAQDYDDYLERERRKAQEKDRLKMRDRHANLAVFDENVYVEGIKKLLSEVQAGKSLGAVALARLLEACVKVERLARGESTENINADVKAEVTLLERIKRAEERLAEQESEAPSQSKDPM